MKFNYFTVLCIILINTLCILSAPVSNENALKRRGCKYVDCPKFCPVPGGCPCQCVDKNPFSQKELECFKKVTGIDITNQEQKELEELVKEGYDILTALFKLLLPTKKNIFGSPQIIFNYTKCLLN